MSGRLEHVNITVPDARATASVLSDLFGWNVRWEGPAIDNGFTVHVGNEDTYLALYTPRRDLGPVPRRYRHAGSLAHIGIVVEDIEAAESRVAAAGFTPHNHADYEPGRRFYFDGPDGVEYEVVSYS